VTGSGIRRQWTVSDAVIRRFSLAVLVVLLGGGALRIWAAIAYPMLDMYDSGPVWTGVSGGIVLGVALWLLVGDAPALPRLAMAWAGAAAGWMLVYGAALVANGIFDRSEPRLLRYAVHDHWHGRRSIVTLYRTGPDGPAWLRLPEQRATVGQPPGTRVTIPVRDGTLGFAWRAGPAQVDRTGR